jgi:hypothetical protein
MARCPVANLAPDHLAAIDSQRRYLVLEIAMPLARRKGRSRVRAGPRIISQPKLLLETLETASQSRNLLL